ncbi:MAG: DUF2946 family protein [Thermoguttaceae bacterium]|jgi:hypothetical protein
MSPNLRRIARWLVLGGYLLTMTVVPWLHDHSSHHHGQGAAAFCGQGADRDAQGPRVARDSAGSDRDEECPVCQFLSQQATAVRQAAELVRGDFYERLLGLSPAEVLSRAPLLQRSRAPPPAV